MPKIYHNGVLASLAKRGRYYQLTWRPDGKKVRKSTGCSTLEDARAKAVDMLDAHTESETKRRSGLTLSNALERIWNEHWYQTSAGKTRRAYVEEAIEVLDDPLLSDIGYTDLVRLQQHWASTGIAKATVNRKVIAVRSILGRAVHPWNVLSAAPPAPRLKESKGQRVSFSDTQIEQIIEHSSSDEWRWLWKFMVHTGARKAEVIHACQQDRWSAFQLEASPAVVTLVGKGNAREDKKIRYVPLSDDLTAYLKAKRDAGAEKPWDVTLMRMRTEWERIRTELGQQHNDGWVIHALRHTCATRRIRAGMPGVAVQHWLGHSSFSTTQRYISQVSKELDQWTTLGSI